MDRVRGAGLGGIGGDRLRNALRRYGPFREVPDSPCVARLCVSGVTAQLFRTGRGPAAGAQQSADRVLCRGAALGALPFGPACDRRHHYRVASGYLGGLFDHPPGRATRHAAAHGNPPYLGHRLRPDLCAPDECLAVRRRGPNRADLQKLKRLGGGLWHRGHRHHGVLDRAGGHRCGQTMALAEARGVPALRILGAGRFGVPVLERAQDCRRRLAAAGHCWIRLCRHGNLAAGTACPSGADLRRIPCR